jgi:hypothetical protein
MGAQHGKGIGPKRRDCQAAEEPRGPQRKDEKRLLISGP